MWPRIQLKQLALKGSWSTLSSWLSPSAIRPISQVFRLIVLQDDLASFGRHSLSPPLSQPQSRPLTVLQQLGYVGSALRSVQLGQQLFRRGLQVPRPTAFLRRGHHLWRQSRRCRGDVLANDVLKPARVGHLWIARGQGVQFHRPFRFTLIGLEQRNRR